MKVLVIGASGIIGQTLRLCIPKNVSATFTRTQFDALHSRLDITDNDALGWFLQSIAPDVIINLAGENRPDVVERDPAKYYDVNVTAPAVLSRWCDRYGVHYIHLSTQGVFGGDNPPYDHFSPTCPVNAYGNQKVSAEVGVERSGMRWTIVRPTFVMGVRPMPGIGRENPAEHMLSGKQKKQVADRRFSVSFARDVANEIWHIAMGEPLLRRVHIGIPSSTTRYGLASLVGAGIEPARHTDFPGLAPRPIDTTYAGEGPTHYKLLAVGMIGLEREYDQRTSMSIAQYARELSIFTTRTEADCRKTLDQGFGALHSAVAADYRRANPKDDAQLLEWYRQTEAYCWELAAYHCDAGVPAPGFNYKGMCAGVAGRLLAAGAKRVLCLGDGIGDLTLALLQRGIGAVYHDLAGSRTAAFAQVRLLAHLGYEPEVLLTDGWAPAIVRGTWNVYAGTHEKSNMRMWPDGSTKPEDMYRMPRGLYAAPKSSLSDAFARGKNEGEVQGTHTSSDQAGEHSASTLPGMRERSSAGASHVLSESESNRVAVSAVPSRDTQDGLFDAVVSCDFLEHLTDVPAWVEAIKCVLKPGGLFMAQNAFACGSGPDGSIPMHLAINDRFEKDWDPLLLEMGFSQESSNWYVAPTLVSDNLNEIDRILEST